jgi:hypothetical protein
VSPHARSLRYRPKGLEASTRFARERSVGEAREVRFEIASQRARRASRPRKPRGLAAPARRTVQEMRQERLRVTLPAPRLPTDATAIYHWKVRKLDGTLAAMDDLIRQVAFLNFWSTMCMPCVKELASIEGLHSMLRAEPGLEVPAP